MGWLPKSRVVAPIDFSDASLAAIDTALELVDSNSNVHVIHVLPIITDFEAGIIWDEIDGESRIKNAMLIMQKRLSDAKYKGLRLEARIGDAGHEIADFAEGIGADLVVLPSHGRTGIRRVLLGSVAERVVRLCHCPVLVLKAN